MFQKTKYCFLKNEISKGSGVVSRDAGLGIDDDNDENEEQLATRLEQLVRIFLNLFLFLKNVFFCFFN